MQKTLTIQNLTKVSLEIRKGVAEDGFDRAEPSDQVDFIYGTDPSGLTDFEYLIAGKKVGDEMIIKPGSDEFLAISSHFACAFRDVFNFSSKDNCLLVKVSDLSQATDREIIAAMAGGGSCGGSCDCGCGH